MSRKRMVWATALAAGALLLGACSSRGRLPLLAVATVDREAASYLISVIDPSTGEARRVSETAASLPGWSPDGRRLAFLAYEAGGEPATAPSGESVPTLYVYDIMASTSRSLRLEVEPRSLPVWTPDGESLVFAATVSGQPGRDLYMVRPDGSGLERLTTTEAYEMTPGQWSADGQWLTVGVDDWVYSPEARGEICAAPCGGRLEVFHWAQRGFAVPLEYTAVYCEHHWSPDGALLAFLDRCSSAQDPPRNIFVWDASSLRTERLTRYEPGHRNMGWGVESFAWSDTNTLYYTMWDDPTPLYELDVESRLRRLVLEGADGWPSFTLTRDRGGRLWLAFVLQDGLWIRRDGIAVAEAEAFGSRDWTFAPDALALAGFVTIQEEPHVWGVAVLTGLESGLPNRQEFAVAGDVQSLRWAPAAGTPVIAWWWIVLGVVVVLAGGATGWLIRRKRIRPDVPGRS